MPLPILAAAGIAQGLFQVGKSIFQNHRANHLKQSKFMPKELLMNRDLASQQAYSRRAPGQAFGEEMIRRNQANSNAQAMRLFGGDANKIAAYSSSANAQANDANQRLQAQGQSFSENAFGRLYMANNSIAGQKRENYNNFQRAKGQLYAASDQNLYNSLGSFGQAAMIGADGGMFGGGSEGGLGSNAKRPPGFSKDGRMIPKIGRAV